MAFPADAYDWDIKARGRSVTFARKGNAVPTNPAAPWEGGTAAADTQTVTCKFKAIRVGDADGDRVRDTDVIGQLIPGEITGRAPTEGDQIIDGTTTYEVVRVLSKKPGATPLRYDLQLRA